VIILYHLSNLSLFVAFNCYFFGNESIKFSWIKWTPNLASSIILWLITISNLCFFLRWACYSISSPSSALPLSKTWSWSSFASLHSSDVSNYRLIFLGFLIIVPCIMFLFLKAFILSFPYILLFYKIYIIPPSVFCLIGGIILPFIVLAFVTVQHPAPIFTNSGKDK
jgi:hypothetical protein